MSQYLIGYDVRKSGTYPLVYKTLGSFEECTFVQQSLYLIATDSSEAEVTTKLRSILGPRDSLLVIKVN